MLRRGAAIFALSLLALQQQATAAMPKELCHVPAAIDSGDAVKPNVMLLIDNSGSMGWETYANDPFDPNRNYYGYFDSTLCYRYQSNTFQPGPASYSGPGPSECEINATYSYSGNFLNWGFMSRMEVMKRALIGGVQNAGGTRLVPASSGTSFGYFYYCGLPTGFLSRYTPLATTRRGMAIARTNDRFYFYSYSDCYSSGAWLLNGALVNGIDVSPSPKGVLDEVSTNARWALGIFDSSSNGGQVEHYYGFNQNNSSGPSLDNRIENLVPSTNTPLGEALYEMMRYHMQIAPFYVNNHFLTNIGGNRDPWYEWEGADTTIPCRDQFIIVISDGSPTSDTYFPGNSSSDPSVRDIDPVTPGMQGLDYQPDNNEPTIQLPVPNWPPAAFPQFQQPSAGTPNWLDDIAQWGNTTDMRPDIAGMQKIVSYFLFAFGDIQGSEQGAPYVMWEAAKGGAFIDQNNNGQPDLQSEWDSDGDGVPDAFFLAEEGDQLEQQLRQLLSSVLNRTTSGTKASIMPQQGQGRRGGTIGAQAYFEPQKDGELGESVTWAGFLRGAWLDAWFNFRDASVNPNKLDLKEDRIAIYEFVSDQDRLDDVLLADTVPVEDGKTVVRLYWDLIEPTSGVEQADGAAGLYDQGVLLENFSSLFEAGVKLHQKAAADRTIFTSEALGETPTYMGGTVERLDFTTTNASLLRPLVSSYDPAYAPTLAETVELIDYVRGVDAAGKRNRTITVDGVTGVWKLGDIMFSNPIASGPPPKGMSIVDSTALAYETQYADRPYVLFAGANDGMLHAFYVGKINSLASDSAPDLVAELVAGNGYEPGEEIWAYIPHVLLPHLRWLMETDYCHTYYVDGNPEVKDIRAFPDDAIHPEGWGRILIGSLRLGCTPIEKTAGTFYYSAIFVLDITDPLNPQPLYEWFDPTGNMGYTTSQPQLFGVSTIRGSLDIQDFCFWLVFGSGPQDRDFITAASPAQLYLRNLNFGANLNPACQSAILDAPKFNNQNVQEVMATPLALDVWDDQSGFFVREGDVIYFPSAILTDPYGPDFTFNGRILRLDPVPTAIAVDDPEFASPDPSDWLLTEAFSGPMPFTTQPQEYFALQGKAVNEGDTYRIAIQTGSGRFYNVEDAGYYGQQYVLSLKDECFYQERFGAPCDTASDYLYTFNAATPNSNSDRFLYLTDCILDLNTFELDTDCDIDGVNAPTIPDFINTVRSEALASPNNESWIMPLSYQERVISEPAMSGKVAIFATYLPVQSQICSAAAGQAGLIFTDLSGITYLKETVSSGEIKLACVGEQCEKFVISDDKGGVDIRNNPFLDSQLFGIQSYLSPFKVLK